MTGARKSRDASGISWSIRWGLLLAVLITSAGLDDGVAAPILLGHATPHDFPRLLTIFADQKYHNHALDAWMAEHRAGWRIEITVRPEGTKGFAPLAKRWVIERTNAWHGRYCRNSKDYERSTEASTAMIQISNIHLMLNRLCPCDRPAFHYRKQAASSRCNRAKGFRIASDNMWGSQSIDSSPTFWLPQTEAALAQ